MTLNEFRNLSKGDLITYPSIEGCIERNNIYPIHSIDRYNNKITIKIAYTIVELSVHLCTPIIYELK